MPDELLGRWMLQRAVADHRSGSTGSATGVAEFVVDQAGVACEETGDLYWAGQRRHFRRGLLLRPEPGEGWWVQFPDGRRFHPWTEGNFSHFCGADRYAGRLSRPRGGWQLRWAVLGPLKDYVMVTDYRRLPTDSR